MITDNTGTLITLECAIVANPRYLDLEGIRPSLSLLVHSKAGYRSVHLLDALATQWRDTLAKSDKITVYGATENDARSTEIYASHIAKGESNAY